MAAGDVGVGHDVAADGDVGDGAKIGGNADVGQVAVDDAVFDEQVGAPHQPADADAAIGADIGRGFRIAGVGVEVNANDVQV